MRNIQRAVVFVAIAFATFGNLSAYPVLRAQHETHTEIASKLRTLVCQGAWQHSTRLGPIAVEARTLTFFDDGKIESVMSDDTGMHPAKGVWSIKESDGEPALIVDPFIVTSGSATTFYIRYNQKDDALELRYSLDTPALKYERAKGGPPYRSAAKDKAQPLTIGETFTIDSRVLSEKRRINVYIPSGYSESPEIRLPVLYMPDGGMAEDFLHIAGLVQVSVGNGTMRPFLLVGIENTERRRDMTGPTENENDKKIAPRVGGSAPFRMFIRDELMPQVKSRYRTTNETAIVGESLAGLFVVETFFLEPGLFDTYIAFDPSLWWNNHKLVDGAGERLGQRPTLAKNLYIANSADEMVPGVIDRFVEVLRKSAPAGVHWHYESMPDEQHSTIYHPAALKAFRALFKPAPGK